MTYTLEQTKALLDAQVAKRGADYVYPNALGETECVYFDADTQAPSCIVGHLFADIGLTPNDVPELGFDSMPAHIINLFEPEARVLLTSVQMSQDQGSQWGEVVKETYKYLTEEGKK